MHYRMFDKQMLHNLWQRKQYCGYYVLSTPGDSGSSFIFTNPDLGVFHFRLDIQDNIKRMLNFGYECVHCEFLIDEVVL